MENMSKTNSEAQSRKIPWLQIIPIILSLFTFLLGGGYFYNNFINRPVLAYTVLESYDLGSQFFSGVVIENRGKQNLTDINLTISNLTSEITALNFPGLHEPISITSGGINTNSVTIEMPRLSSGKALSVYVLSAKPLSINEANLLVSSSQAVGQESSEIFSIISFSSKIAAFISILSIIISIWSSISLWMTVSKRKDAEIEAMQKILNINESTTDLESRTRQLKMEQNEINDGIKHMQNSIADANESLNSLSEMLREAVGTGKIESNDQVENILYLLENYKKDLSDISQTSENLAKISKTG